MHEKNAEGGRRAGLAWPGGLHSYPGPPGAFLGLGKGLGLALKSERGFLATYLLVVYFAFFLTVLAFLMGMGLGMAKQVHAKRLWFAEALDFAVRAANVTGDLEEVVLKEDMVREYFTRAMDLTVREYRLEEFRAVRPGDSVRGGRAKAPGYYARVRVPVLAAEVPLVGPQYVEAPLGYFAVVKSGQL